MTPETYVGSAFSANDILIVLAGGASKHSCLVPTFGPTRAMTRAMAFKDGTAVSSVEAFI